MTSSTLGSVDTGSSVLLMHSGTVETGTVAPVNLPAAPNPQNGCLVDAGTNDISTDLRPSTSRSVSVSE